MEFHKIVDLWITHALTELLDHFGAPNADVISLFVKNWVIVQCNWLSHHRIRALYHG